MFDFQHHDLGTSSVSFLQLMKNSVACEAKHKALINFEDANVTIVLKILLFSAGIIRHVECCKSHSERSN